MTSITLTTGQLAAIFKAIPKIAADVETGKPVMQVIADTEPAILPILETVAGDIFPFGGMAVDLVALFLMNQKTLTPEQQAVYQAQYDARVSTT